eukprot:16452339-Heterocapsa_arctica.AAC.1
MTPSLRREESEERERARRCRRRAAPGVRPPFRFIARRGAARRSAGGGSGGLFALGHPVSSSDSVAPAVLVGMAAEGRSRKAAIPPAGAAATGVAAAGRRRTAAGASTSAAAAGRRSTAPAFGAMPRQLTVVGAPDGEARRREGAEWRRRSPSRPQGARRLRRCQSAKRYVSADVSAQSARPCWSGAREREPAEGWLGKRPSPRFQQKPESAVYMDKQRSGNISEHELSIPMKT